MNIIEVVKNILNGYSEISKFTNGIHVDFTDPEPTNFGLSSLGETLIKKDVLGNKKKQHNFVLYARNQAYTDFDRLSNSTFLLDLGNYLDTVKGQEVITNVNGVEKKGELIEMSSANGMLFEIPTGNINDGVTYQLQIYAQYSILEERKE
jgi:hypothetical protein